MTVREVFSQPLVVGIVSGLTMLIIGAIFSWAVWSAQQFKQEDRRDIESIDSRLERIEDLLDPQGLGGGMVGRVALMEQRVGSLETMFADFMQQGPRWTRDDARLSEEEHIARYHEND